MAAPLPIDPHLPEIVEATYRHGAAVVVAPPGSGKTTRVPPALLNSPCGAGGQVLMLEPRRIAARAAARRIAFESGTTVGGIVGYHVRFDRVCGPETRLLVVTEGILTRRLQNDPALAGVGVVVLDEFHERSLHADLAIALLREVRAGLRPDLKVVVMSATIDPGPVAAFLGGAPVVQAPGRPHPVELEYLRHSASGRLTPDVVEHVCRALQHDEGDVLVFLPGMGEILQCRDELASRPQCAAVDVLPLHGSLPPEQQDRALQPGPRRKVVLATNVAETSITVEGVRVVVDSGFARQMRHDPRLGLDHLEHRRISRASADQRAGRAGRTAPGKAYRLWTEAEHRGLEDFEVPEIRRVDLAPTVLELRAWGVQDPAAFEWFEAPGTAELQRGTELLARLGALDAADGRLTELGSRLLGLPVHPRLGRLLLEAHDAGHSADGAVIAALLAERDILDTGGGRPDRAAAGESENSDVLLRLERFRAAQQARFDDRHMRHLGLNPRAVQQVRRVADQLGRIATARLGKPPPNPQRDRERSLLRAVLAAFPDRVVKRRDLDHHTGVMVGGRGVLLTPESVVQHAALFVAVLVDGGSRQRRASPVRWASAVEEAWLGELFPQAMNEEDELSFDEQAERVVSLHRRRYLDLVLHERPGGAIDPQRAAEVLADAVRRNPEDLLPRDDELARFVTRLRCLRSWHPELQLPDMDDAALVEALVALCPGKRSFAELRARNLLAAVKGRLSFEQLSALEREAPERLPLPRGRRARIRYEIDKPPVLSARIQDLFGLTETPRLAGGRVPCVVEILAPNQRPIQITQDLASFWATTYPRVRKDLRGRYPKHAWPEKPQSGSGD